MEAWKPSLASLVNARPKFRGAMVGSDCWPTGVAEGEGRVGWMRNGSGTRDAGGSEQAWRRGRPHGGPLQTGAGRLQKGLVART